MMNGNVGIAGNLSMQVIRQFQPARGYFWHVFWWQVRQFFAHRWREVPLWCVLLLRYVVPGLVVVHGCTRLRKLLGDGTYVDYGVAGRHLITTAGKQYVASTFDNTAEPELFKFHGYGTGTTAAALGDTALQTELTTEYVTNSTRPTGSQAHSAATYTTVATLSPDSGGTIAVTEWGLFSASSSGTLLDRQVFSAVNLVAANGDSLQTTYVLTIS